MQINEIRDQFHGISNDFRHVKRRQKYLEILLMVSVCLILISFFYNSFFQNKSETEISDREIELQIKISEKNDIIQNKQKEIDKLNRQIIKEDFSVEKKEIKKIIEPDIIKLVEKPNPTQNYKYKKNNNVIPEEKKKDSITPKEN